MTIPKPQRGWPIFETENERDTFFDKCISNGYRVRRACLKTDTGLRYTVADIDERHGPVAIG